MSFDSSRAEHLALIMEKNQEKKITFHWSKLNAALSIVIATRPCPIDLYLEGSEIDGDTFLEHLQNRRASFGSLEI